MKATNFITTFVLAVAMMCGVVAHAASPAIDTITVQGYIKKVDGTAVTDGSYNVAFGVFQNGTALWGTNLTNLNITSGLFSASLSGTGTNLSSTVPVATGTMKADWSSTTLNAARLFTGTSGAVMVRVYAISTIDGNHPQFDITLSSVPTAFVSQVANSVADLSVTTTGIAAGSKTNAFTGVAGQLILTDASGLIASGLLPTLPTNQFGSGVIGISNGGTNNGSLAVTNGGMVYTDGSKLMNSGAGTSGYFLTSGGAGAPTWSSPSAVRTAISSAASGSNSDITGLTNLTTALTLAQGGSGASLTATNGGIVYSGAGAMAISAAGTSGQLLTSNGAASPTWTSSLSIAQGGTNNASLAVTNGGMLYTDGSKVVNSGVGTSGQLLTSGGAGAPTWTTTLGISQGGTANNALGVTAGGVVYTDGTKLMNTGAAVTSGYFLTSGGVGTPTWTAPGSMLTAIGGAGTGNNSDIATLTNVSSLSFAGAMTVGGVSTTGVTLGNGNTSTLDLGSLGSSTLVTKLGADSASALSNINGGVITVGSPATTSIKLAPSSSTTSFSVSGTGLTSLSLGGSATGAITATVGATNTNSLTNINGSTIAIGSPLSSVINDGGTGLTALRLGSLALGSLTTTIGGSSTTALTNLNGSKVYVGGSNTQLINLGNLTTGALTAIIGSDTTNSLTNVNGAAVLVGGNTSNLINLGNMATGALTTTIGSAFNANSKTTVTGGSTGKITIGANGVGFQNIGLCQTGAVTFNNTTGNSTSCTGLASYGATFPIAVMCSGNNTVQVSCRQNPTTSNFVWCASNIANTQMATYTCMWVTP